MALLLVRIRIFAFLLAVLPATAHLCMALQRPVDPWVYAGSLDDHARVLFVALDHQMWVAYDTEAATIYKAWDGLGLGMPSAEGFHYLTHEAGTPWRIVRHGVASIPDVTYRGYRLFGEQLTLVYAITTEYDHEIIVEEHPEIVFHEDGRPGLQRVFHVEGLPDGFQLALDVSFNTLQDKDDIRTDGVLQRSGERIGTYVWGKTFDISGRLILQNARTTTLTSFFAPNILDNLQHMAQLEPADLFRDTRAFQDLNEEDEDDTVNRLIRSAGHEPGASLKIYGIGESIDRLSPIAPGQLPSAHSLIDTIDLKEKDDFGGPDFYFISHINGFLNIATPGIYSFKVQADDGFRLTIADSVLIEHDGLQAARLSEEVEIFLSPGVQPLLLEHFQSTGQKQLTLFWKPPWQDQYDVVAAPVISTQKEEERRTSPGKKRMLKDLVSGVFDIPTVVPVGIHPTLSVEEVRIEEFGSIVGGMDRLSTGEVVVATWEAGTGRVLVLEHIEDDKSVVVRKFADGLDFPLGLKVVDDEIFVLQKQELTHLLDNDGNGLADEYRVIANNWHLSTDYEELSFGLEYHEGSFYAGLGVPLDKQGAILIEELPERGEIVRIDFDGQVESITRSFHLPNGIAIDANGALLVSDHRNPWFSDSRFMYWEPGADRAFLPDSANPANPLPMGSIWIPTLDGPESPSEPLVIDEGVYTGQWLIGDLKRRDLKRLAIDTVNATRQGAVFLHSVDMPISVNRYVPLADGSTLSGSLALDASWGESDEEHRKMARLSFQDEAVFEVLSIHATAEGFDLKLTQPVDEDLDVGENLLRLYSWPNSENVRRRFREDNGFIEEHEIQSVEVVDGGSTLRVIVSDLKPASIVYFNVDPDLRSEAGDALWTNEAWYSLNEQPTPLESEPRTSQ